MVTSSPDSMKSLLIIISVLIVSSLFASSEACGISTYWGQNSSEGTLVDTCDSGLYQYVNLAFLSNFGRGGEPVVNLDGHEKWRLSTDIRACQAYGVKVLLSLGGPYGTYGLVSIDDAKQVATYLWENFLAPNATGELGDAPLDGIDFNIIAPFSHQYWDELVKALADFDSTQKKLYLSASPQCVDYYLEPAIKTGLFDHVSVQFFNQSSCDFEAGLDKLLESWNEWSTLLPAGNQLFLGVPASQNASKTGYIEPARLKSQVLPAVRAYKNYGGVMVWDRLHDKNYSKTIKPDVCKNKLHRHQPLISMV
ncbi:Acidic endochitinase [Sesamum alatum]|uniref:Acidic endochitinase n=1 Tax=Sesamum alatum TaxID=300844 RepID=A0AAE2CTV0_9LAMI|nr:Acidic endochitinase [Sesamum alatum]